MRAIGIIGFASLLYLTLSPFSRGQDQNPTPPAGSGVETLVCIRHGEKPANEIGQINIQGLNRSLALPKVLVDKFGKPQFLFAPDPAQPITSKTDGNQYCYIRPLATIEPTAILLGLPVNTMYGFKDIKGLESELRKPIYQNSLVFIAWEHLMLEKFARSMVIDLGGDGQQVPVWDKVMGFDAIYLIKITTQSGKSTVSFSVDHEGLDHLSDQFPTPAPPASN